MTEISDSLNNVGQPPSIVAARIMLLALVEAGVHDVVLSPGSRSAPLAFAAVDLERAGLIALHTRIDERSAAFTALGMGSISNHSQGMVPAVVITTSGTAVANLHPAILEAKHSKIPLIVITADRPAELRGTGANQTTDQVAIFGSAVRYGVDVPAPEASHLGTIAGAPYWRDLASRTYAAATGVDGGQPGPVHLNLAYREPLVPKGNSNEDWVESERRKVLDGDREVAGRPRVRVAQAEAQAEVLDRGPCTVIVAGDRAGSTALALAEKSGWPLLAEPSSGVRGAKAVANYRFLLEHPELGGSVERVVLFGHPTLSRAVARLIGRAGLELIVVTEDPQWTDPSRRASVITSGITVRGEVTTAENRWSQRWNTADQVAEGVVSAAISDRRTASGLVGLAIARAVAQAQRPGDLLWVGSSSAIRDLDVVSGGLDDVTVLAQRGLAGIDGTISAATGAAVKHLAGWEEGSGQPPNVTVYLGDLTFLHDVGGLLLGPSNLEPELRIVVANDQGGAIFHTLEPGESAHSRSFERAFGTPHNAEFAALAKAYGLYYRLVKDANNLAEFLATPVKGREIIEVQLGRTDRRVAERALLDRILFALNSAWNKGE